MTRSNKLALDDSTATPASITPMTQHSSNMAAAVASLAHHDELPQLALLQQLTLGEGVRVAVLDGPVDTRHECFNGARLSPLPTLIDVQSGVGTASCHGTHVASILFGQPVGPRIGVAPLSHGLLGTIFADTAGNALTTCSQLDLARAIGAAVDAGAHIINISGGQFSSDGTAETWLEQALRRCAAENVLIIAAAGNDGCDCLHVPAAHPSVLAVGAMDADGAPLSSSNWGAAYADNGILAPGSEIAGALAGGGITFGTGTSFATALVSGVAALLLGIQIARGRAADPRRVCAAILSSAVVCEGAAAGCQKFLAGRLNIAAALHALFDAEPLSLHPSEVVVAAARVRAVQRAINHDSNQSGEHNLESTSMLEVMPVADARAAIITSTAIPISQLDLPGVQPAAAQAITPSDCGCADKANGPSLVYALGLLSYDFPSEARRDSLVQQGLSNPSDPAAVLQFLAEHPDAATALTFVLSQDATPIYAVRPAGPYAPQIFERLRQFLAGQLDQGIEQISVPGYAFGKVTLMSGQTVPILIPELRGMYSWSTPKLVAAVAGTAPQDELLDAFQEKVRDVTNFLERVYYEIRNLGATPQERAMNFAATNAFQIETVFHSALKAGLKLDSIGVERSPICRPGADCWDVKLVFFNPVRRLDQARRVYRFSVDVSDVIPVTVGKVREWDVF